MIHWDTYERESIRSDIVNALDCTMYIHVQSRDPAQATKLERKRKRVRDYAGTNDSYRRTITSVRFTTLHIWPTQCIIIACIDQKKSATRSTFCNVTTMTPVQRISMKRSRIESIILLRKFVQSFLWGMIDAKFAKNFIVKARNPLFRPRCISYLLN